MHILMGLLFVIFSAQTICSQVGITTEPDERTIIVNDAPEMEVYAFGKNVVVKTDAKGVLVIGGDVTIEGKVSGDVAAIGGSVFQTENAFIGGDVIVFGGKYQPESGSPLRVEGKETVIVAMFESEIRHLTQNPSELLSPSITLRYLAQRLISILFWFIISIALTTIAPGAVSRSTARFQLIPLKVLGIGLVGFFLTLVTVVGALSFLPNFVSAVVIPMTMILLMLSYVYGRVALHVIVGKAIQKHLFANDSKSETIAILLGVLAWTVFLSLPYLWVAALLSLVSISVGLVLTARSN